MRILFTVQGEGRGHLTQALAVHERLAQWGHELVGVVVGRNKSRRDLPSSFTAAFAVPITSLESPSFALKDNRRVDVTATVGEAVGRLGTWRGSVKRLRAVVDETRPDLVLNFFEPLTGLAQWFRPLPVPVLAIGHQFLTRDPSYGRLRGRSLEQWGMRRFVDLVGHGSWQLALALEPAPDRPEERWLACPPLLRRTLFSLSPTAGDFLLVYVVNHGYGQEVAAWHAQHRDVPVHCFSDRPGSPPVEEVAPNLTYHRLDGELFLRMMAQCRGVATTAGFESVSEAAWLGKPLLVVPVEGHVEQTMNALDTARAGLGTRATTFDLDPLLGGEVSGNHESFRSWVSRADQVLERALHLSVDGAGEV